jgi:methylmalonyl-CoA/ethylmalonyl-CoA epimerase
MEGVKSHCLDPGGSLDWPADLLRCHMRVKRIEHIAIATRRLQEVKNVFENVLGLSLAYEEVFPKYNTQMAMYSVGETFLEIIEGTSEAAEVEEWVRQHGEGLYHVCFEVDDIDESFAELKQKGLQMLSEEPIPGHDNSRIFFVHPRSTAGLLIEFVQLSIAASGAAHGH